MCNNKRPLVKTFRLKREAIEKLIPKKKSADKIYNLFMNAIKTGLMAMKEIKLPDDNTNEIAGIMIGCEPGKEYFDMYVEMHPDYEDKKEFLMIVPFIKTGDIVIQAVN